MSTEDIDLEYLAGLCKHQQKVCLLSTKIFQDWGQGKNVELLISMKGHKYDVAKIYFQKPVCSWGMPYGGLTRERE